MTTQGPLNAVGIPVWSEGESIYGLLVSWEPPSTYFKAGALSICEIVKAKTDQGHKYRMAKLNESQKSKGVYNRRTYIWKDLLHGVLEAINRLMSENLGESGPDVIADMQYDKRKSNRAIDDGVAEFSEFGTAPVSDADDTNAPF